MPFGGAEYSRFALGLRTAKNVITAPITTIKGIGSGRQVGLPMKFRFRAAHEVGHL